MHPADADYTMDNLPDEDVLEDMLDSAIALTQMLSGQSVRRRRPAGTEVLVAHPVPAAPERTLLIPTYEPAVLENAVASALAEPGTATAAESATIASSLAVLREHASRLRGLAIAQDGVMVHALNSIDLGLIGLAKVMGDAD